jgi:hypothetical protein
MKAPKNTPNTTRISPGFTNGGGGGGQGSLKSKPGRSSFTNSRKIGLVAVGVIFLLSGLVMAGQGAGYVGGSYMTGDPTYIYVGGLVAIIGLAILVVGLRARGKSMEPTPAAS